MLRSWQRLYRAIPEFRGKARVLREWPGHLVRRWPSDIAITSRNGSLFYHCDLNDYLYQVLFFSGCYESDVDWMCSRLLKQGDVFVDIGACYGYHTLTNARRVGPKGRVFAFEPQPDVFAALEENIRVNKFSNILAERMALSDRTECLQLHTFPSLGMGHTSIGVLPRQPVSGVADCNAVTLDDYITRMGIGHIELVKLDVEGAERKVLLGSKQLLSRHAPPLWIIEANPLTSQACGYEPRELQSMLAGHGYSAYLADRGKVSRRMLRIKPSKGRQELSENVLFAISSIHATALARLGLRRIAQTYHRS